MVSLRISIGEHHAHRLGGSVTGAARLLNVPQPAVSATLKHCESQLRMER